MLLKVGEVEEEDAVVMFPNWMGELTRDDSQVAFFKLSPIFILELKHYKSSKS